jgi:hypothetical protein
VKLEDIAELHFITPMGNLPSILKLGILSHNEADRLKAISVADPKIQERRQNRVLPNAGPLHSFANLYFHARNPMMCKLQNGREQLAVLRVDRAVLNLPGVIVSDGNAASNDYTRFYPSPAGLAFLDKALVFARDWRAPNNPIRYYHQKRSRCAEVLVPKRVEPRFILGAYVCSNTAQAALAALAPNLASTVEADLFTI